MSEPTKPDAQKEWLRKSARALIDLKVENYVLLLHVAHLEGKAHNVDPKKIEQELTEEIQATIEKALLDMEKTAPHVAAWIDDLGRPGDQSPPSPP